MTVSAQKAELLVVIRHLKGCLAQLQQVSDFVTGDENDPRFRPLIDDALLDCNARLDMILREELPPNR